MTKLKLIRTGARTEIVDVEKFVRIYRSDAENIKSAKIIPPKLGKRGYGKIEITRRRPRYSSIKAAI